MRLGNKVGIVVGGGQQMGATIGNGRAACLVFAHEGAKVMVVDRDLQSAQRTVEEITESGGTAIAFGGDWTRPDDCRAFVSAALAKWDRIDFLQNNVGTLMGDAVPSELAEADFDRILSINLKGCLFACQSVLPQMRAQSSGTIVNVSSLAATGNTPLTAYKISKAGMNALTQALALENAAFGIRVNAVAPGLLDTPMGIIGHTARLEHEEARARQERNKLVPLRGKMGTAWDTAHASLYLHSDDANFVTGIVLPVDGGMGARIG